MLSVITPQWIQAITDGYVSDPATMEMIAKLSVDPQAVPGFSLRDGILRRGKQIRIGDNASLQQRLIQATHSSVLGAIRGFR